MRGAFVIAAVCVASPELLRRGAWRYAGGMPEDDGDELAERVRAICMALPGVTERPSHGAQASQ